jgi:predicted ATPase
MLRKFTVNNFKSLINVTYEPGNVNLFVGVNNSGKTNFCQALRFLSQTAQGKQLLARTWGRTMGWDSIVKNVYFDHPTVDLGCTAELTVAGESLTFHYSLSLDISPTAPVGVATEQLQVSGGGFGSGSVTLLKNKAGQAQVLNEVNYLQNQSLESGYEDTTLELGVTMLSLLHDRQANARAMAFRDYLAGWQYYDLNTHRLRDDRFDPQAITLNSEGANLVSVLFMLKSNDERTYRRLLELAQTVEKRLDALNFAPVGEHIKMELTDAQGHRFDVTSASGGTLRFMALAYVILNNARQSNPPLTIIEEPENGLYVRYLKPLFELIQPMGTGGQYIFTSHSPYFIDLFEDYLENITLMEDQGTHSALLKPYPTKVRQYLEEMPLGELHFREMLV